MIALSLLLVLASLGLLVAGLAGHVQSLVWVSLLASLSACGCLVFSVLSHRRTTGASASAPAADGPPGQPIDLGSPAPDPALPTPISPASPWASPPPEPPAPAAPPPAAAPASPFRPPADPADFDAVPPDAVPPQRTEAEQWPTGDAPSGTGPFDTAPSDDASADPEPARPAAPVDDAGTPPAASPASAAPADEPPVEDIPVPDALRVAQLSDEVLVVDGRPRYHLADCGQLAGRATVPLPVSSARRAGFTPCAACRPDSTLLARSRSAARPPR